MEANWRRLCGVCSNAMISFRYNVQWNEISESFRIQDSFIFTLDSLLTAYISKLEQLGMVVRSLSVHADSAAIAMVTQRGLGIIALSFRILVVYLFC